MTPLSKIDPMGSSPIEDPSFAAIHLVMVYAPINLLWEHYEERARKLGFDEYDANALVHGVLIKWINRIAPDPSNRVLSYEQYVALAYGYGMELNEILDGIEDLEILKNKLNKKNKPCN